MQIVFNLFRLSHTTSDILQLIEGCQCLIEVEVEDTLIWVDIFQHRLPFNDKNVNTKKSIAPNHVEYG